jgi:hypothetical protein
MRRRSEMIRSGILRLLAAIALVASVGLTPSSASAAQAFPQHCAVRLVPVETSDRGTVAAELVHLGCFQTFARSIAVGSGGKILLPATTTPGGLTQRAVDMSTTWGGSTLIGTEYTADSYAGSSHSYFASSTCSAGTTWEVADVGASWNNDFESGKGFGGCDANKKFAWQNFGGDVRTCTPNCATYGALQNDVSSLRWRP